MRSTVLSKSAALVFICAIAILKEVPPQWSLSIIGRADGRRNCRNPLATCPDGPDRLPIPALSLGLPEAVEVAVRIDRGVLAILDAEARLGGILRREVTDDGLP